ncbi:MAG: dTMP kinase, partial [Sulfurovum sp.]
MYVIFEGIDTCGKTTQIALLKNRFKDAIITKEPGGTAFGKE